MSFVDRNIYFQQDHTFELIGTNIRKFLVFSIKKTYQSMYRSEQQNTFQTFLLVKSQSFSPPQKFLVFARQKVLKTHSEQQSSENQFLKSQTYYSSFLRHVDLTYCRKLSQVLQLLNIDVQVPIQNQWFLLYEVHNYKPSTDKIAGYELKTPVYGSKVSLTDRQTLEKRCCNAIISNLFRRNSQNVYFVSDSIQQTEHNDLELILSSNENEIYGLTYKVKDEIICIPLNLILYEKPCQTFIDHKVKSQLQKTCYVSFMGSYCTGIQISHKKIITARHLLPSHQQRLDTKVTVKKYPYKQNMIGVVSKIGLGSLDIMQIEITGLQNQNRYHRQKQNNLIKQQLTATLQRQQQQNKSLYFRFKKSLQNSKRLQIFQQKSQIGEQIIALGFGRFSYGVNIFNSMELVLPTVANGIVSKFIEISSNQVFLKTDAKLFSGFSGCGIWKQNLVAMAVFILKNKTSNSNLNRQNFSYTSEFIKKLIKKKQKQITVPYKQQIQHFDKIQTRHQLNLTHSPKPKL